MPISIALTGIVVATLATIWTLWPQQYLNWIDTFQARLMPSGQPVRERLRVMLPFSLMRKPKLVRICGVAIWVTLLSIVGMTLYYKV